MNNLLAVISNEPELQALAEDSNYPAIAAWLNERVTIENPAPQQDVDPPVDLVEIFDALAVTEQPIGAEVKSLLEMGKSSPKQWASPSRNSYIPFE